MPIFRLAPVDLTDPDWKISSHQEMCLVHADQDGQARKYASDEFLTKDVLPGFDLRRSPWVNPERTTCEVLSGLPPENYREGQIEIPSHSDIGSAVVGGAATASGPIGGAEVGGWQVLKLGKPAPSGNYGAQTLPKIQSGGGGSIQDSDAVHGVPDESAKEVKGVHWKDSGGMYALELSEGDSFAVKRTVTIGQARDIVVPAHMALKALNVPNDLSEEHRDMISALLETVASLERQLSALQGDNQTLASQNEELLKKIAEGLPLWKRARDEFVIKAAGTAGSAVGGGTMFVAGLIARELLETLAGTSGSPSVAV